MALTLDHVNAGELDALFRKLIRLRDRTCQFCGTWRDLECAHIIRRRYRVLRWDECNAIALCRLCHAHFTEREDDWKDWNRKRMGPDAFADLHLKAHRLTGKDLDAKALRIGLRKRLVELEES